MNRQRGEASQTETDAGIEGGDRRRRETGIDERAGAGDAGSRQSRTARESQVTTEWLVLRVPPLTLAIIRAQNRTRRPSLGRQRSARHRRHRYSGPVGSAVCGLRQNRQLNRSLISHFAQTYEPHRCRDRASRLRRQRACGAHANVTLRSRACEDADGVKGRVSSAV